MALSFAALILTNFANSLALLGSKSIPKPLSKMVPLRGWLGPYLIKLGIEWSVLGFLKLYGGEVVMKASYTAYANQSTGKLEPR